MTDRAHIFLDAVTPEEIRSDAGELFPTLEGMAETLGVPLEIIAVALAAHAATRQGKVAIIFPAGHERVGH